MAIPPDEIRTLRERLGLTQADLAKRLCLSRPAVAAWESGRNTPTGPAQMLLQQLQVEADAIAPPVGPIAEKIENSPDGPIAS
ncbi:hypothetical protein LCGC14_1024760 [marine sediment metagenome]|uniref:HTH cro/C1-type domain-containing protein n=1 Tax=marine sediment metagenome TaxID=412755 RepID=A0A0F9MWF5_9ZZZZ